MGNKAGAVLLGILTLFLLFGPFQAPINAGIDGWRSSSATENFIVTTNGSQTAMNVTLSHDLYKASVSEVTSVTSNATESPVATNYTSTGTKLEVSALAISTTRTLTVTYTAETDDVVMQSLGPFLSFLIFGSTALLICWGMWQSAKGKRR